MIFVLIVRSLLWIPESQLGIDFSNLQFNFTKTGLFLIFFLFTANILLYLFAKEIADRHPELKFCYLFILIDPVSLICVNNLNGAILYSLVLLFVLTKIKNIRIVPELAFIALIAYTFFFHSYSFIPAILFIFSVQYISSMADKKRKPSITLFVFILFLFVAGCLYLGKKFPYASGDNSNMGNSLLSMILVILPSLLFFVLTVCNLLKSKNKKSHHDITIIKRIIIAFIICLIVSIVVVAIRKQFCTAVFFNVATIYTIFVLYDNKNEFALQLTKKSSEWITRKNVFAYVLLFMFVLLTLLFNTYNYHFDRLVDYSVAI